MQMRELRKSEGWMRLRWSVKGGKDCAYDTCKVRPATWSEWPPVVTINDPWPSGDGR